MDDLVSRLHYLADQANDRVPFRELRQAAGEIVNLRKALWKYGKHLTSCPMGNLGCTCGWASIRETLGGDALRPSEREQLDRLRASLGRIAAGFYTESGAEQEAKATLKNIEEGRQMPASSANEGDK